MKERNVNNTALTNCEAIVMKTIWDGAQKSAEGLTCTEVRSAVESLYGVTYKDTTVYTFLKHLADKGFVTKHRRGVLLFKPVMTEEEYLVSKFTQLNQLWFHGDKSELQSFVSRHDI